ncbi:MAG: hypothetical protein IPH06_07085 [Alphaproteobacteria bacterium]|nr:hypothetical protein [Alphaproteobacteria bacterium]QQS57778.1 MAG: hypothetical protein IPN28_02845 [Alphaproteobacteria bacterium]
MNLSDFERRFLDRFQKEVAADFEIGRNDYGILTLTKKAPCEEIGTLNVFVKPHDIMISCKVTHTHCAVGFIDQDRRTDDPEHDMITEAIGKVNDFINDRIVVSETRAPNGNLIGSGWSPLSAVNFENPEYQKLIEDMHGTPITEHKWTWSGPFKKN